MVTSLKKLRAFTLAPQIYKVIGKRAKTVVERPVFLWRTIALDSIATYMTRIYKAARERAKALIGRASSLRGSIASKSKAVHAQWEKIDISARLVARTSQAYKTVSGRTKAAIKRTMLLWRTIISSIKARYVARKKANKPTRILVEHAGFSRQIWYLAWMDLQKSYRGALLGWLWVVARPLMMLSFYWFIVAIGLHSDSIDAGNYAYLPWLVVGLCAWFFVSDMINIGVGAFRKYKFLIAKTKFPVATIPTIVLISNAIVHGILLTLVLGYLYTGGYVAVEWLQLPLYIILALALMWFWSLLAAPLGAISKDFTQLVKSLMRVLVWVSGILWSVQNIPIQWLREIMQLNPIYFLAEGYRKSLMYHEWFFEDMRGFLIFMAELTILAAFATVVYKRSRKDLADIL